LFKDTVNEVAE